MDISKAIEPKSDQQNADSFLAGPRTIRIRDIKYDPSADTQPLWIYFDGDEGKPWKPCRTAARCLVHVWGADASKWIGLSCTLYCDPEVTFGAARVGGIRVSHMEGLTQPKTLQLTKTRGKKGATVIKPLVIEQAVTTSTRDLRAEMEAVASDDESKRKWWSGLTADEREQVRAMSASGA